ncbi:trehalose-phosphatase [candidate division KSB1 bacterium]|nr:trehalose-phosphatase [candidate division KSB1 bacterium]
MKPKNLKHALNSESLIHQLNEKKPAFFLDYDGTLTPIVNRPEDAILTDEMREVVKELSQHYTVAIVSGRDKKDVQERVSLENLIYAGSHGFDISGPHGMEMQHEQGNQALPDLDEAEQKLNHELAGISGCQVERKKFSIAVHYRNANPSQVDMIKQRVSDVHQQYSSLRMNGGKMIVELQPDIDWDKGKAVLWLMKKLNLNPENTLPVYIGDDLTDEHAFQVLKESGIGVLIGEHGSETAANYILDNVSQVRGFLQKVLKI